MSIQFRCPNCNALLATSTDKPGSIIACARCHNDLIVPESAPPVANLDFGHVVDRVAELTTTDRFVIIEPEPSPDPRADAREREDFHEAHVGWWRNPVVVVAGANLLLCLVAFCVYVFSSRTTVDTKRIRAEQPTEPVSSDVPSDLARSSKDSPRETPEEPPPRAAVALVDEDANTDTAEEVEADPAPPPNIPAKPPIAKPAQIAGDTFDLRGPAPKVGFKVTERTKATGARTTSFAKPRSKTVSIRTDYVLEHRKSVHRRRRCW